MRASLLQILFLVLLLPVTAQKSKTDALISSIQKRGNDTVKLRMLEDLALSLGESYPDSAFRMANLAERIADSIHNKRQISIVTELKGLLCYYRGKFDSSLIFFERSLELKKQIGWKRGMGTVLNSMGSIYTAKGEYEKAVNSYFEALKNSDQFEGSRLKGSINNNIGLCFQQMGELDKALIYFNRAIEAEDPKKTGHDISSTEMNIAIVYSLKKNYGEAVKMFNSVLRKFEAKGDLHGVSQCCNNLSSLYIDLNKYDLALVYGLKAMNLKIQLKEEKGLSAVYNNLGNIYFFKKNFNDALKYHQMALELSEKYQMKNETVFALQALSSDYEATGNDHEALMMYRRHVSLRDSIFNGQKNEKINAVQVKYETEKKDKQIYKALAELKEKKFEAREKEIQRNAFIAGSALLAVLALLVFRSYRQKQKANVEISRQKEIIEEKNRDILDSIRYARRIQTSLLPSEKYFERSLQKNMKNKKLS